MPLQLTRRALLTSGASAMLYPRGVDLAATAYAAVRIVKETAGAPSTPEILLPAGYDLMTGAQFQAASRVEYLTWLQGPTNSAGIAVTVRWPGERIAAIVTDEKRLALTRDEADPQRVSFTLPTYRASATAAQPTVQVWSYLSREATGLYWHVEHNDPDRAARYWQTVPWPEVETPAAIAYMTASQAVLADAGLIALAQSRGHFYALMGFETNNPYHQDNPPHWHLSYYPGPSMGAAGATVPHFWVDRAGRIFYNGQDVQGSGRTPYRAGEPAPIRDAAGGLVLTTTIRVDGGLDVDPPAGPRYSILPPAVADPGSLRVLKDGVPWREIVASDAVRSGQLDLEVRGDRVRDERHYRYDPLCGPLLPQS